MGSPFQYGLAEVCVIDLAQVFAKHIRPKLIRAALQACRVVTERVFQQFRVGFHVLRQFIPLRRIVPKLLRNARSNPKAIPVCEFVFCSIQVHYALSMKYETVFRGARLAKFFADNEALI